MELEEAKNYTVSKETTPLAKYIAGKLVELGSEHLQYVKNPYCFVGGVNVGMSKAYQDILNKLHDEKQGEKQKLDGVFINVDEVRESFMATVYSVLSDDLTNDRANDIINAFDNLPSITISNV